MDRKNLLSKLAWQEKRKIGKGTIYVLQSDVNKAAGWVQPNGMGKYEADIPGIPTEAIFKKNLIKEKLCAFKCVANGVGPN